MPVENHIKDIDWRAWSERNKNAVHEIMQWYDLIWRQVQEAPSERLYAQMAALSSVLWLLLDEKRYKRFMKPRNISQGTLI